MPGIPISKHWVAMKALEYQDGAVLFSSDVFSQKREKGDQEELSGGGLRKMTCGIG